MEIHCGFKSREWFIAPEECFEAHKFIQHAKDFAFKDDEEISLTHNVFVEA